MVLEAKKADSEQARDALERLCSTYWFPLYAFVRRKGHSPHEAQDLVQGFFEQLLAKSYLESVHPEKGKFRTFLLTALTNFLANDFDKKTRLKRGGGCQVISINADEAEHRYLEEPADQVTSPDQAFDRAWAQTVFDTVLSKLHEEYRKTGDEARFNALQQCLMAGDAQEKYVDIAPKLGLSEGGVKTSVRRMRLRFRDLLREELARTLAEGADLSEEIRHMIVALR